MTYWLLAVAVIALIVAALTTAYWRGVCDALEDMDHMGEGWE